MPPLLSKPELECTIASGDELDVRQFSVQEKLSSIFSVTLVAASKNPNIDFEDVVGKDARFKINISVDGLPLKSKAWDGVVSQIEQVSSLHDKTTDRSMYKITIVPTLWLLTQRRNHRMFQQINEPDIVLKILKEWAITPKLKIDAGSYKKRKYRVQYGESDYAFICRMLEDVGITFYFEQDGGATKLVLADAPQANPPRAPIVYVETPSTGGEYREFTTQVTVGQAVRPGKYTMRDHDYRKPPAYKLMKTAEGELDQEQKLERFHYVPGSMLFNADKGDSTPVADDKGKSRHDEGEGEKIAKKRLAAKRARAKVVGFETTAIDLSPGIVMSMKGHPRTVDVDQKKLLVLESTMHGMSNSEWSHHVEARSADEVYHPPLSTPKPRTQGVESATVVGPPGEEIHTDEFGRVRVHFHWDRESKMDDNSSTWIHVSQPWAGTGYGGTNLPRVGQEVLVDFLGGDPDRPVIVGRVYTNLQKKPYGLPANKTQSGWKSNSTNQTGGYNELMFEDKAGKELFRIQGEKDFLGLIKHDASLTIGHDSTSLIKHDETHTVGHDQKTFVVNDRTVQVGQDQKHWVKRNIEQASLEGQTYLKAKERFTIESELEILIKVGESTIAINGEEIIIKSPKVSINPEE
jgi:type VI secretion system secreted protein VgrG